MTPPSLRYDDALEEALCSGWIDGPKRSIDDAVFGQRFTPRPKGVALVDAEHRDRGDARRIRQDAPEQGQAEVDRAKADGRWDRAYAGAASAEVPEDLAAALAASPAAAAAGSRSSTGPTGTPSSIAR